MTPPKTHNEHRKALCVVCFNKSKNLRPINIDLEDLIKTVIPQYRPSSKNFPSSICTSCRVNLSDKDLLTPFDYKKNLIQSTGTEPCSCLICSVGRQTIQKNTYGTKKVPCKVLKKHCLKCFSEIARGKSHICTPATRKRNLKLIAEAEGLKFSKGKNQKFVVTQEDMIRIKNRMNLSTNQIKILAYDLRRCNKSYNRTAVEPNVLENLHHASHVLDNYFTCVQERINDGSESVSIIYCSDALRFIEFVKKERKILNAHIKIGMDSGGGNFKITICLIDKDKEHNKREPKSSGVNKLFIIGLSTDTKEEYDRVKRIWDLLKLNDVLKNYECSLQCDLKLMNIIIGIMSCSSKCPCPYCDTSDLDVPGTCRTLSNINENFKSWIRLVKSGLRHQLCVSNVVSILLLLMLKRKTLK